MDKYAVYHSIKSVQTVAAQYPAAREITEELERLAQQLSSRIYRVAVIGEFKRGKSSLVNCLLGTEILPTDILPSTAVVNRIVYGTEQKIEICYKNGNVESTTVAELEEYATKQKNANASRIREIVVHYPAVFCQNNMEILDTPGLNDDEFMDRTTLDVLDRIDTAIVTTHASYPVGDTEKKLICRLLEQDDIYHLTFVATFIDRVSDEPDEQDQVIGLIRSRLSKDTYQMFCRMHPNDQKLLEKAKRILCNPVVFAVSSKLAMKGFVSGNKKLLDESRFPHFRYELAALLTANQELDLQMKAARLIRVAGERFPSWHEELLKRLDTDLAEARSQLKAAQAYQKTGCEDLTDRLLQADRELEDSGVFHQDKTDFESSDLVQRTARTVMRALLQLDPRMLKERHIERALKEASEELRQRKDRNTEHLVRSCMREANEHLMAAEKSCGIRENGLAERLDQWNKATPFPNLSEEAYDILKKIDPRVVEEIVAAGDIVELATWVKGIVSSRLYLQQERFLEQLRQYVASWRSQLLKQNQADRNEMAKIAENAAGRIRDARQRKEAAAVNYEANLNLLIQTEKEISHIQ